VVVRAADGKSSQTGMRQGLAVDYPSWFRWCDCLFGDT